MLRITSSFFVLALFYLAGCGNNETEKMNLTEKPFPFPIVLDTIKVGGFYRHVNDANPRYLSSGHYYFNYIGKYKQRIYASFISFKGLEGLKKIEEPNAYGKMLLAVQKYYLPYGEERNYKRIEKSDLEIRINPSVKISGFYPVMLTNKDSDTCFIGSLNQLPLILEAKDKQGKWKPIQSRYAVGCGTGVGHVFLPPNYIAVTLVPIFKGKYQTQLRLKCGKNHSEPFNGSINYSQFESKKHY
ncbi:hypothetical protein [uncultured Fluviicola sp.]|uniref:hypothetical protein n=1 Tax=uncultured Fluviicola sp. TaxID=463303 RepID=UPI0025E08D9D|nr:hypothetical protein [uncultured Fluviicola sp.]